MYLPRFNLILAMSSLLVMTMLLEVVESNTPPACLFGVLRSYPNPADVKSMCSKYQQEITSKIAQTCSSASGPSAAMNAYAATCLSEANVKVAAHNNTEPKGYPSASISAGFPSASTAPNFDSTKPKSSDKPTDNSSDNSADKSPAPASTSSSANFNYPSTAAGVIMTVIGAKFLL